MVFISRRTAQGRIIKTSRARAPHISSATLSATLIYIPLERVHAHKVARPNNVSLLLVRAKDVQFRY